MREMVEVLLNASGGQRLDRTSHVMVWWDVEPSAEISTVLTSQQATWLSGLDRPPLLGVSVSSAQIRVKDVPEERRTNQK